MFAPGWDLLTSPAERMSAFPIRLAGDSFINSPLSYGFAGVLNRNAPRPAGSPRTAMSVPPPPAASFGSTVSRCDRSRAPQPSSVRRIPGTPRRNARRSRPECPGRPGSPPPASGWSGRAVFHESGSRRGSIARLGYRQCPSRHPGRLSASLSPWMSR